MSVTALAGVVGWTLVTFLAGLVFDAMGHYKVQLAYISPAGKPSLQPRFLSKPALRHVVILVVSTVIQYFCQRSNVEPTTAAMVLGPLLIVYAVLLFRDAILKQRHAD